MNIQVTKFNKLLLDKKLSIAFAESITCGLMMHQLSTSKGTAAVLLGGIVCYNEEIKTHLLRVPPQLIKKHTAESQQVTNALAKGLSRLIKADISAAVTGLASTGGTEESELPSGTVFFSVYYHSKLHIHSQRFLGSPLMVRKKSCNAMYDFITRIVNKPKS